MFRSRWRVVALGAAAALAVVAGCLSLGGEKLPADVADALDTPDSFTLYSLDPGVKTEAARETFHEYAVLGKTEVKDRVTQRRLAAALARGVRDHDGSIAACFVPHHGVRVQRGKRTVDLVVCFMCAQVKVYVDGKETEGVLISTSPRPVFNEVLTNTNIPLAEKAKGDGEK